MARDRKRAKQRQRRRAQQQQRAAGAPRPPDDEIVHDAHEDEPDAAPDPLAHSSAEVDIAELAEASVEQPGAPDGPLESEEYPQPDELEGADALQEAPVKGSRPGTVAPGAALPREGSRLANFLRAVVAELRRVQWPDRRHVGQATGVVLGFVLVAGGYLGVLDAIFSRFVEAIL